MKMDRVKELRRVKASELIPNEKNWRTHPPEQKEILEGILNEVGIVGAVIAYETPQGLKLIDGHLRAEMLDQEIPVIVLDVNEKEADKVLATYDPVGDRAETDPVKLKALLTELDFDSQALQGLADELEAEVADLQETPKPELKVIIPNERIIEECFKYYRIYGFPYRNMPLYEMMQEINKLANTDRESLKNTKCAYMVADTYHHHRYHANADGRKSIIQAFNDDKSLQRACMLAIELGDDVYSLIGFVHGAHGLSNFRPGYALHYYQTYAPENAVVLDTSTGFGGRMIGFFASGLQRYIGIDPNTLTHNANLKMANDLGFADKIELINLPAEDVPHETVFERCDFAFTSPPYFCKEHYSEEETQSWRRYPEALLWRDGFLKPMLALQFAGLKHGCYSVVNIADVNIKGVKYPLADWTVECAKEVGFTLEKTDEFLMPVRFGANHSDERASEPVFIFQKP